MEDYKSESTIRLDRFEANLMLDDEGEERGYGGEGGEGGGFAGTCS